MSRLLFLDSRLIGVKFGYISYHLENEPWIVLKDPEREALAVELVAPSTSERSNLSPTGRFAVEHISTRSGIPDHGRIRRPYLR
jgi:hypothetical protein